MVTEDIEDVVNKEEIPCPLIKHSTIEPEFEFLIESNIFLRENQELKFEDLPSDFYENYKELENLYTRLSSPTKNSIQKIQLLRKFAQDYAQTQR